MATQTPRRSDGCHLFGRDGHGIENRCFLVVPSIGPLCYLGFVGSAACSLSKVVLLWSGLRRGVGVSDRNRLIAHLCSDFVAVLWGRPYLAAPTLPHAWTNSFTNTQPDRVANSDNSCESYPIAGSSANATSVPITGTVPNWYSNDKPNTSTDPASNSCINV